MFGLLKAGLSLGGKLVDRVLPNRAKLQEQHLTINAETERTSGGKMTPRKLFAYVLVALFVWEGIGRTIIATYYPHVTLPPSMLDDVLPMLSVMFGLGI